MNSGRLEWHQLDRDTTETEIAETSSSSPITEAQASRTPIRQRLQNAVQRTRNYLLEQQHAEGYWLGELEGDTILESEYILLLAFLGRERSETARCAANYILQQQLPDGGWSIYPGGPLEISATVKAYFALKLTGHSPEADHMRKARTAIREAGGAERVNSFTRYFFALLGVISYEQCPAVPPELILIPKWAPFNIYEMSAWSRTILVPLSLMWAYRPVRPLPEEQGIRELFLHSPEELPMTMGPAETLDELQSHRWIDWEGLFRRVDRLLKFLENARLRPVRQRAIRQAADWMLERFENSDGLGAIFPPIIWSVVALKCLGYPEDSGEVQSALRELEKLSIREGETIRLQPCKSPVWDTAITTVALREAGVRRTDPAIRRAVDWLLAKEVRQQGDWSQMHPRQEPGGWFFEFHNAFYPDCDDTAIVLIALSRCLPDEPDRRWSAEFLVGHRSGPGKNGNGAAIVSGHDCSQRTAREELDRSSPLLNAIRRGANWLLALQSRDGGWGAFNADNNRELFTRVPFADHNAMIDPSAPDLTARCLEALASLNVPDHHPAIRRAVAYIRSKQEPDASWYGRWGVNYIYGTWQSLVGLTSVGVPHDDPRIRGAANWLKSVQQENGGWGESPRSYDEPHLRGQGEATASQTAWALMGLMAAGEGGSQAVRRGIGYLLETQNDDGTWDEPFFTGTGFPKVFYLKYHYYRIYFPLMALSQYRRLHG